MNYTRDVIDSAPSGRRALITLARDGTRRTWTFGEVADRSARLAGELQRHGIGRSDVVMTLIGSRPEWIFSMLACFRLGAVALPCTEQLRAKDLRLRLNMAKPSLVLADERNRAELERAGLDGREPTVLTVPAESLFAGRPAAAVELTSIDPSVIIFTSGTSGTPKAVIHGQRYLWGQRLQAQHWLNVREDDLVWCTAATGWSKSARNAFIAPWLFGATALLHDQRFDPAERLGLIEAEGATVLCMAPTEYRVIAKRHPLRPLGRLRTMVAAGEALNPEVLRAWKDGTGLAIRDGYGQSETGQLTAMPIDTAVRSGSMGRPLPGVTASVLDGELVVDPRTVPTFFLRYVDAEAPSGLWRTGDRVHQDEDGFLYFEGRADDVIISAGYRIGPFEVESALVAHPAVAEAAAVPAPDVDRGAVVRAVVVLRDGYTPGQRLVRELQDHVKRETAPFKYPRIIDFVAELPKTASGKVRRSLIRDLPSTGTTVTST